MAGGVSSSFLGLEEGGHCLSLVPGVLQTWTLGSSFWSVYMGLFDEEGGRKWENGEMGNFVISLCPEPWRDSYRKGLELGVFSHLCHTQPRSNYGTLDLALCPV